jgi:hypothetical protein
MISNIYAEFLKEFKKLGGELSLEQEIALKEIDEVLENNFGFTEKEVVDWKKKTIQLRLS